MWVENQEEHEKGDREGSKENNNYKMTVDNSTEEGNFKMSTRRIPTSSTNKRDGEDLNRSSVL